MNNLARLGFAIPAYRRPENLDVALQSIVPQAAALDAPIYIADDSCDQTNVAVVAKWSERYPRVIHEINEKNLGIDRNIDRAIVRCPADYVHVIGDDDVIFPGFAERVIAVIGAGAPAHIVCSYLYVYNDYRVISGQALIPPQKPGLSLRTLLPTYGWALGFIGSHVFNRNRFAACDVDGYGTYFHHLVRLIHYVAPDEPLGFVEQPLVGNRADDEFTATWSGDRLRVVFGLEQAFEAAMRGTYSEAEVRETVASARRHLGYTEFFRLLYWAALAERSGEGGQYWNVLAQLVPRSRYRCLRAVPKALHRPLLGLIPVARRTKRYVRRLGMSLGSKSSP